MELLKFTNSPRIFSFCRFIGYGALILSSLACTQTRADPAAQDTWLTYGTRGAVGAAHAQGQAQCTEADVRTDDLSQALISEAPSTPWPAKPVESEGAFCGNRDETLAWRLVNCERITRKIAPLKCDLRVLWLARLHSKDMVAQHFFAHQNPQGLSPFDRMDAHGIRYNAAAENIAFNPSVVGAHRSWMNSTGHRENILNKDYSYTGVGIAASQETWGPSLYLTEGFIRPPAR